MELHPRLPIDALQPELETALSRHRNFVLEAPTGSGKSTRLPLWLVEREEFAGGRLVLVLQPRRVAARLLARFGARQLGEAVGERVGYQVRFERCRGERTQVLYVTEGILARWLSSGADPDRVGAILFDEFHERHLEGDWGLALARGWQEAGWKGRIGILSATLQLAGLTDYLGDAAELRSAGRSYPVDIRHWGSLGEKRVEDSVLRAVRRALREGIPGNYLLFLSGRAEIERVVRGLRELPEARGWEILPLFGSLSPEEQDRATAEGNRPRMVVATNLAETSVTLPGIRTVVDSGWALQPEYDPRRGVNTLLREKISRASAEQRAGRAGRVAPGWCLRLWTEADHAARPAFTEPELARLDLTDMRLQASLPRRGIRVRWLEEPPTGSWDRAGRVLESLGVLEDGQVNAVGQELARLPLHPRFGRILLAARAEGCLATMLRAVALLESGELLLPLRDRKRREERESWWADAEGFSDLLKQVLVWRRVAAEGREANRFAREWGVRVNTLRQAERIYGQLVGLLGEAEDSAADGAAAFGRSLLSGYGDHVGWQKTGTRQCWLVGGRRGEVEPDSVVREAGLFVAVDLQERATRGTVKVLAGGLTHVREEWVEAVFPGEAQLEERDELDLSARAVVRRRRRAFRGLVLREELAGEPEAGAAARLLAEAVQREGWVLKKWDQRAETLLRRINVLARNYPEWGMGEIGEEERLWLLEQICEGATRYKEIKDRAVEPVLLSWLPAGMEPVLERTVPERLELPGSRHGIKLRYEEDGTVVLAARIQQLYDIPGSALTLCEGRQRLRLELLAPNGRPVHITEDLDGFWTGQYPQIRKELFGRYPKHEWR